MLAVGVITTSVCVAHTSRAQDPSATVDEQTMAEARKHFQAGVNLLDGPDGARYEEAYHAFHKAYALSGSPKVLGNIGFCSLKLERDGEAIDAYTTYLRESRDVDPRERAQIEKDIATLSSTLATFKVTVKTAADSFIVVDTRTQTRGAPIVNSYSFKGSTTTLRLRPGHHSFRVKTNDTESRSYEVSIEPASQTSHEFTFAPPPTAREAPRTSPSYAGPIILGVVGLAAIGTGTLTGMMARSTTDSIESHCPNDVCPKGYDLSGDRSEAKTLSTVADAAFIGGGVAVGGALLWALLTPSSGAPRPPRTGSVAWNSGAACTARGCGVQIGGEF
jgi:hypothetical protein